MKKFTAQEIILFMITACVCLTVLVGVLGIVIKGSSDPSQAAVETRVALIRLLDIMIGGVLGSMVTIKANKDDK